MSDELPHSLSAEQALLGILLCDNLAIERVPSIFRAEHMFDPVHQRLAEAIMEAIQRGGRIELISLGERFQGDKAFEEMGGFGYLADLVDKAPSATNTSDFCHLISDFAIRREGIRLCQETIASLKSNRATPALETVDNLERGLFHLAADREEKGLSGVSDAFAEAIEMAAAAIDREGELAGLSSGLHDLDKKTGGLANTDLVVIAARPSMGKTSLAMGIAENVAKAYQTDRDGNVTRGGVSAVFSLEMSKAQLGIRLLAGGVEIPSDRILRGQLAADDFGRMIDYAQEMRDAPLYIDDTGAISLEKVATRARRLKRTVGLNLIVIDYLQLMTVAGGEKLSPNERVSRVTAGLKALAKELNVPVIALSQLTRQVEQRADKKPQLSDLKESGAIEQDADQVIFVYRHAYYLQREQPKEGTTEHMKWEEELEACRYDAELIIGKNRHGSAGSVKLRFKEETTKFSDPIRDEEFKPRAA